MIYVIAGLVIGIAAGLKMNVIYSAEYAVYIALVILAFINSIFDILLSNLRGDAKNTKKMMILLLSDLIFALVLGYVGERIGLPIHLAPIFAFGNNIFRNIREMTDILLKRNNKNI
jgi:small basic protein